MSKYCLLVPHYNHDDRLTEFLPKLIGTGVPCIVVDDGSDANSKDTVKRLVEEHDNIFFVEHNRNRGKGAAVKTGIVLARSQGFSHAIQIDADGQHAADDIIRFVDASMQAPCSFICGRPVFDQSVPKVRLYGRKVTDFWVFIETLSCRIKDGLCGFRVYPLDEIEVVLDRHYVGSRMDFDTEILVKAVWQDIDLKFIDTPVIYPTESVSHFRYLRDNIMLIRLHVRLLCGMLLRMPWLLFRYLNVGKS